MQQQKTQSHLNQKRSVQFTDANNNIHRYCKDTDKSLAYCFKVQTFVEGNKNICHLPLFIFWHYLIASNYKWKMGQIFVAFSEYLNITVRLDIHICTYSVCTLYANYNQDIKFPYIIKIYCFKGLDSVSTAITSPVAVSQKSVWPAKLQYAMAHSRPDPPKR